MTLLRGGWVLGPDGTTGDRLDVLVRDGLIAEVGRDLAPGDARVVDCSGSTVMPGLVDAHVHLAMAGSTEPDRGPEELRTRVSANARALVEAGVTTARDVSGPADALLQQRARCAEDPAAGPQLLLCCEGIACVDGHGTEFTGSARIVTEVDGAEAARQAVRDRKQAGADWIKVMLNGADDEVELGPEELQAIVDEARQQGIPVAAHASNPKAVAVAVHCGVDSIEHGNGIDEAQAAEMARKGITLVTTAHVFRAGAGCGHGHGEDPLIAFEPRVREKVRRIMSVRVAGHERAFPAVLRAGARFVVGTDAVTGPIGLVADELRALTGLGVPPPQALLAATSAGAELLRLADRGRVAPGLRADLLVVRGRPDEDVSTVAEPLLVVRGGAAVAGPLQ